MASDPIAELRSRYGCRSTSAIVRALLAPDSAKALDALRRPPLYASHIGPYILRHVERMRCLGYAFRNEDKFIRFDRYLQEYPDAAEQPFGNLARDYIAAGSSSQEKMQRLSVRLFVSPINQWRFRDFGRSASREWTASAVVFKPSKLCPPA